MPKTLRILILAVLLFGANRPSLWAQTADGTITGQVKDPSGAVIPDAQVTVMHEATNIARIVKSNEAGIYYAPQLQIGSYRIEVVAAGFKTSVRQGATLDLGQVLRLDFVMDVGQRADSVTVQQTAEVVATETTSLGNLRYNQQIQTLPLNARGISGLYALQASVLTVGNGVNPSVMGYVDTEGTGNTGYMVDGTTANGAANGNTGNIPALDGRAVEQNTPNLESIAEFAFSTANDKAEYSQITTMAVVTKSGTNEVHGSAFEYNRVGYTSSRSFFAATREALTRNQFGGSLGGPVYIPHLYNGRNRTFFFGAFEGFRDHRGFLVTGKFPNSVERIGNLSDIASKVVLRDPLGGLFPNNTIPQSRISPIATAMLAYVPVPSGDQPSAASSAFNFAVAKPQLDLTNKVDAKIDHHIGDDDSMSARVTRSYNQVNNANNSPLPNGLGTSMENAWADQFSLAETHIFSPNNVNEFRLGYWRKALFIDVPGSDQNFLSGNQAIPGINLLPPLQGFPNITLTSSLLSVSSNLLTIGCGLWQAGGSCLNRAEEVYQATDAYTWVHQRHTVKLGADVRRQHINQVFPNGAVFGFTSSTSAASSATGEAFADFLLGLPTSDSWSSTQSGYSQAWQYSFYAQDDFKVNSRLTVNYGVRWDYYGWLKEKYGRDVNYDYALKKVVVPDKGVASIMPSLANNPLIVTSKAAGLGDYPLQSRLHNFAPRVGLAYQPFGNGKTVVRAAYGIFYTPYPASLIDGNWSIAPYFASYAYTRATAVGAGGNPPSFANPVATGGSSSNLLASDPGMSPDYHNSYSQIWNFTIEQEVRKNLKVRASYVGNKGLDLYRQVYANACLPGTVTCDARSAAQSPRYDPNFSDTAGGIQSVGRSFYNAVQAEVEQRFADGLFFNVNYTHAKLMGLTGTPENPIGNASLDYGPDSNSIAHVVHFNSVWDLPFGRKWLAHARGLTGKLIGGWELSGLWHLQSGHRFTVSGTAANSGTGSGTNRANCLGDASLPGGRPLAAQLGEYFNTAEFQSAPVGTVGNCGVGILTGPGLFNADAALLKNTQIVERVKLQFRAEFLNVFNHPNFANPNATVTSSALGTISGTSSGLFPRQMQFGMRLQF